MSIPSRVNKENFRLLDLSSDDDSEDLQLEIIPSRKKKISRRDRGRNTAPKVQETSLGTEIQCAVRWALRGTLILWLMMLTWICASLYDQVTTMKMDISKVSTSSESVSDALQLCHTAAKELRVNVSDINVRLFKLEHDHLELAKRVEKAVSELETVQRQLSAAPELRDIPKRLGDLQTTVATLGSQINGFDGAINTARKQAVTAASGVEEVKTLVNQLDGRTNETITNLTSYAHREEDIAQQVVALNTTLQSRLQELNNRIEELKKPTTTAAPLTTSPPTSTTTPATTSTATATTPAPAPAVKPIVLSQQ